MYITLPPCRYYADLIGREGLIGLALAQSPEFVAPHGSKQALFGTNPIAISVPTLATGASSNGTHACVTMDMATAAYAWFGLLEAKTAGRPIPPDVALNAQGQPTTDPNEVRSRIPLASVWDATAQHWLATE